MKTPGTRLRRLAGRMCSPRTLEFLIDPIIADLRREYSDAGHRPAWKRRVILLWGYVGFVKAIALHGASRGLGAVSGWSDDDRSSLATAGRLSAAGIALATVVLALPPAVLSSRTLSLGQAAALLFLLPQALPIALPVGFTLGALGGLNTIDSRRLKAWVLAVAISCSAVSLGLLATIVPASNQGYRAAVFGANTPKGIPELSWAELRQELAAARMDQARSDVRPLEFHLQLRLSLACAPLFFAILVLALSRRRRSTRLPIGAAVSLAYLACFVLASPPGATPPVVAAWLPNLALAAGAVLAAAPKALR